MTTISAQTILRSRNAAAPDKVLSTLLLRYPRFIHAEFMTHRVFSRNAASSRAIPVKKLIEDIERDPAFPIFFGSNKPGMQAGDEMPGEDVEAAKGYLEEAMNFAIDTANGLLSLNAHKQIVNRVLEPFAHITVLISATEFDNFLELRDHKDAEPHIQILAREIRKCLEDESTVQTLKPGEWHLPFVTSEERLSEDLINTDFRRLSVARCASTSYKTVDGFDMTLEKADEVFGKLFSKPFHASPFEHVAQADEWLEAPWEWLTRQEHGNFIGFRQYRRQLENAL